MQVVTMSARRQVRRVTNGKGGSLRSFKAMAHRAHRHQTATALRLVTDGRLDEADLDLTPARVVAATDVD